MQDFRNLEVWQVSHQLALEIHEVTNSFPQHELYGLTSQLRRASRSIPTNIAEGCVRKTDLDFARFLYNAMGSASEAEYLILMSRDLGYVAVETFERLTGKVQRTKKMLAGFIRRLNGETESRRTKAEGREPRAESHA